MLAIDLVQFNTEADLTGLVRKACETACNWNVDRVYSMGGSNCQNFVNDLIKQLKIPSVLKEPKIEKFLQQLSQNELKFSFKFPGDAHETTIVEHAQLDRIVVSKRIDPLDTQNHHVSAVDLQILKAIDRAYWFRNANFLESGTESTTAATLSCTNGWNPSTCPFNSPYGTTLLDAIKFNQQASIPPSGGVSGASGSGTVEVSSFIPTSTSGAPNNNNNNDTTEPLENVYEQ